MLNSPQRQPLNVGILLYLRSEGQLLLRFRTDWTTAVETDDVEILELLAADLESKAAELGPEPLLRYLEDSLSNTIQLSERRNVEIAETPVKTLHALFANLIH